MKKFKGGYSCFTEATCPICGKWFSPTTEWVYNNGRGRKVCSYPCHNEARRRNTSRRDDAKKKRELRDREIYMLYHEGVAHTELAERYKLTSDRIWKILRQQKALAALEGAR